MARMKDPQGARPPVRAFAPGELARIRELIEASPARQHPSPIGSELDRIHAAAGRQRGFKLWELDPVTDVGAALAEEISDRRWSE
ncbi:hypothetical protein K8O92_10060 [Nocardia asteroides]|nr:hypothetical protein K8O92_10060 [Nocardia asteroides]